LHRRRAAVVDVSFSFARKVRGDEIEAIRKRSRSGQSGPWVSDFDEMAKKTVFRRASKWLPLSPEIQDVIRKEEEIEFMQARNVTPVMREERIDPFAAIETTAETEVES
jgi:recombination protein RecT